MTLQEQKEQHKRKNLLKRWFNGELKKQVKVSYTDDIREWRYDNVVVSK